MPFHVAILTVSDRGSRGERPADLSAEAIRASLAESTYTVAAYQVVPDERAVHNLEHGGVVASYNNIPADALAALQALLTAYPKDKYGEVKLLIRPYDRIAPGAIVLTAWNWIDELTAYDDARVRHFLDAHLNQCCESVP